MSMEHYDNSKDTAVLTPMKLLYVSSSKYEGDWHSTLHSHRCTEIFYVVSGQGTFQVENTVVPVCADRLVIINSNVEHTESAVLQAPLEYIVLGVEGCDFLLEGSQDARFCMFDCAGTGQDILNYMKLILQETAEGAAYCTCVTQNLLEILSVKLLRHKSVTLTNASTSKAGLQCALVKRYLDTHYKEDISLESLGKITYLNKYYLAHIFTKEYGISPINYLIRRRVAESRYLLTQTDHPISEIASILGFSSPSYFTQSFTRIENISPRDYRKRMRNQADTTCK